MVGQGRQPKRGSGPYREPVEQYKGHASVDWYVQTSLYNLLS